MSSKTEEERNSDWRVSGPEKQSMRIGERRGGGVRDEEECEDGREAKNA